MKSNILNIVNIESDILLPSDAFPAPGPDLEPGDVRHGVSLSGALPPVRPQDVPRPPPPREVRPELSGKQETHQQQNGEKYKEIMECLRRVN